MDRRPTAVRVFKSKSFQRFARACNISDESLRDAVDRAEQGLIDADLGGGVIKQRIARRGEGKSGGYRSIILFRAGDRAFFVHGFEKSAQSNITSSELKEFRKAATIVLCLTDEQVQRAVDAGVYIEISTRQSNDDG